MGCDIHMIVEKRVGDRWVGIHGFQAFYTDKQRDDGGVSPLAGARNYDRFARLAGVRGEGPAPRGLPDDLSGLGRLAVEYDAGVSLGDHSHSWLPLTEAAQIFLETERGQISDYAREYPEAFFFGLDIFHREDMGQYRLVFGFDS